MPVSLLSSSVLKWPDRTTVVQALSHWAHQIALMHSEVEQIGYFGSYARGNWGVGSDVDLIIVVSAATEPFERRGTKWKLTELPVPADVFTYTREEMNALLLQEDLYRRKFPQAVWVYDRTKIGKA